MSVSHSYAPPICPEALPLVEAYLDAIEAPVRHPERDARFEAYLSHTFDCRACERFTFERACQVINRRRLPRPPKRPRFDVGQRVRVVAILDAITSTDLLGFEGTVEEIDELPGDQFNYTVDGRYLNEQMLAAV